MTFHDIPPIINGGWQLSAGHGSPIDHAGVLSRLERLVDAGLTAFDCGDIYVGVEDLLGELRRRRPGRDLRIHTKLVPDRSALRSIDRGYVRRIVDRSLKRLAMDHLDLVQLHWWDYDIPGFVDAALWLDELRKAGKIRAVGVTNFDVPRLREIIDAGVPVMAHQVQYSLLDHRPEHGMLTLCREHDIQVLCYGTLAGGFLSERYLSTPASPSPLPNRSLVKYRLIIDECGGWSRFQDLLRTLASIARKHRVAIASVAAAYILRKPQVRAIIVGARDDRHLAQTLETITLDLDNDDLRLIGEILDHQPGPNGDIYNLEREKGGRHASIMRYDLNDV